MHIKKGGKQAGVSIQKINYKKFIQPPGEKNKSIYVTQTLQLEQKWLTFEFLCCLPNEKVESNIKISSPVKTC